MLRYIIILPLTICLIILSCTGSREQANGNSSLQKEVDKYLEEYNQKFQELATASSEAEWKLNTHIVEGDTMTAYGARQAAEALAKFTGSAENIKKATKFLENKNDLLPIQVRQLEVILYKAG